METEQLAGLGDGGGRTLGRTRMGITCNAQQGTSDERVAYFLHWLVKHLKPPVCSSPEWLPETFESENWDVVVSTG